MSASFPQIALPLAARPFVSFAGRLRENGFAVAPEQTQAFLTAVGLLGPRHMEQVRMAAIATLAPQPDQRPLFDMLFDLHFIGLVGEIADAEASPGEEIKAQDDTGQMDALFAEDINESGQATTGAEVLAQRILKPADEADTLRRFSRALPARLPRRRGYRFGKARRGSSIDMARSLKAAIRNDGELVSLKRLRRKPRPRPLLLLIDVSGSMKERSDANLAFAHAIMKATARTEVFTFGTRLTRITRALHRKNREQALSEAAVTVADWDGGTRIGDALQAFLAVPRFATYARGSAVVIVSDGLERGDPAAMITAVSRLAARAWRIDWLTPLAADPGYRPETEALAAVRPLLGSLANGATTERLCSHVLALAQQPPSTTRRAA
jgi:uncharacterized protein with von Willebrand factor type A (vWA) domain